MAYQQHPHDQQQYYQQQQQQPQQQPYAQYGSPAPQQHSQPQIQQYSSPSPHPQQQYATPPPGMQHQHSQGHVPQMPPHQHSQGHVQQYAPQHQHQGYQAQAPMQAAYAQVQNPKGWQNSLMDCGPCESCLLGCCLPCILLGQTSERQRDQTLQTYDTFNTDCLVMCGISYLTGCGWIYVMMKRSEIREKFGIEGDGMSDCCVTYWCGCCALIQQDKEVEARMPPGAVQSQGYQAQAGMQMPQAPQQAAKA